MKDSNIINEILNFYINSYNISSDEIPKTSITITENMLDTCKQLAETKDDFEEIKKCSETISSLNGKMVLPTNTRNFMILINAKQFNENDEYIRTLIHEFTHVLDYYNYMIDKGVNELEELKKDEYFWAFYFWTEYHARYMGNKLFYIVRNMLYDCIEDKSQVYDFIYNKEFPFQSKHLKKSLIKFKEEKGELNLDYNLVFQKIMYDFTQYVGRISLWKEYEFDAINDERFPVEELTNLLSKDILQYYNILLKYNNFNDAKFKLIEIINRIYRYTLEH